MCHLNSTKILFFYVNVAVMMAPVCSARQNAENAPFKKRAILVVFLGSKVSENLPFCQEMKYCSFSLRVSETQSTPISSFLFCQYFSAHFFYLEN